MYFTLFLYVSEMISAALRFLRVLCNNAALIYYEKCLDKCLQEIRNAVQWKADERDATYRRRQVVDETNKLNEKKNMKGSRACGDIR